LNFFRRQRFVGKIRFGHFDVTADRAIIATEDNVLAAVSSKNGDILWRRVLETDESRGSIRFLHVNQNSRNVASQSNDGSPYDVITVSGHSPILFRGWNINSGNLAWEWSITPTSEKADDSQYFFKDGNIYHVLPVWNSHIELTEYHATTGQQAKATSSRITAGWITKESCKLSSNYFSCLVKDQLLVLDLLAAQNNVRTKTIDVPAAIEVLAGREGFIQVGTKIIALDSLEVTYENRIRANIYIGSDIVQLTKDGKDVKITTNDDQELSLLADIPETLDNNLKIVSSKCKPKKDSISTLACRFLLTSEDGAIALVQQSKIKWIREEALTKISSVEFLDLTLSDAQGAIEEELNNKDGMLEIAHNRSDELIEYLIHFFTFSCLVSLHKKRKILIVCR